MRLSYEAIAQAMAELHTGPGLVESRVASGTPGLPRQPLALAPPGESNRQRVAWHWIQAVLHAGNLLGFPVQGLDRRARQWWNRWDGQEGKATRLAQVAQGQHLLDQWRADGWLHNGFRLRSADAHWTGGVGAVLKSTQMDAERQVWLNIRPHGDIPISAMPSLLKHGNLGFLQETSTPVFRQWLVLAHEAAHTVGIHLEAPFSPSPAVREAWHADPRVQANKLEELNRNLFGMGARGWFHEQFDEAFADVYGAMMVLRSADFHPQAVAEVHLMKKVRQADQNWFSRNGGDWTQSRAISAYETTAPALHLLLERQEEWRTLPPAALQQVASEIVSDAWLQTAAHRSTPLLAERLADQPYAKLPPLFFTVVESFSLGTEGLRQWSADRWPRLAGTVGLRLAEQIIKKLREVTENPGNRTEKALAAVLAKPAGSPQSEERMAQAADAVQPMINCALQAWDLSEAAEIAEKLRFQALEEGLNEWAPCAERILGLNPALTPKHPSFADDSLRNMQAQRRLAQAGSENLHERPALKVPSA